MAIKQYIKKKLWNEKHQGVYGIFDLETGDCLYIGKSKALNRRIDRHKTNIKNLNYAQKWYPGHLELYKSLAKHKSLFFKILDECETSVLKPLEKFYKKIYQPKYNIK